MWCIAHKILNATDEQHEMVAGENMLVKKWKNIEYEDIHDLQQARIES